MKLTIIEQNGWKKSVELDKAIIRIGSSEACDIQIASSKIAPVQLQIHYLESNPSTCKVLNIGSEVSVYQNQKEMVLPGYATTEISHGTEIVLDDYRVQFNLPFAARIVNRSNKITAELTFADASMHSKRPTIGNLWVRNDGEVSACQFEVALSGLPVDCIQVDPVPVLYPGAEENVRVHLVHHGAYPAAGSQELTVVVTSPESYPGEQVIIQHGVFVDPVLAHEVLIDDDLKREEKTEQEKAQQVVTESKLRVEKSNETINAPVVERSVPLALSDDTEAFRESAGGDIIPSQKANETADLVKPQLDEKNTNENNLEQTEDVSKEAVGSAHIPDVVMAKPALSKRPDRQKPQEVDEQVAVVEEDVIDLPAEEEVDLKPKQPPRPKPKIVRSTSEDFWDDEE